MKINKIFFLIIYLLTFTLYTTSGQVSIAPKIGLSYSKLSGDYTNARYMPGAFFGGMLNVKMNPLYSFQSGVLISGKGTTLRFSEVDDDQMLITYIEIPLNSTLTAMAGAGFIQLFAGPYIGLAVKGQYRYLEDENNLKEKIRIGTSTGDEIKPFDLGINLGIGYLFEGMEVQAGYSRSFSSVSNISNEVLLNNVITISLGYFFNIQKN